MPLSRASILFQQSLLEQRDGVRTWHTGVGASAPITTQAFVNFNVGRAVRDSRAAFEAFVSVGFFLGDRTGANLGYESDGLTGRTQADVQQSLPVGEGYGYRLRLDDGATLGGSGAFQYQGPFGR